MYKKLKIGTIGKFHIKEKGKTNPKTKEVEYLEYDVSGVVVKEPSDEKSAVRILDKSGIERGFRADTIVEISSARLGKELREILTEVARFRLRSQLVSEEINKLENERYAIQHAEKKAIASISNLSGVYSPSNAIEKMNVGAFRVTSYSTRPVNGAVEIVITESNNGERYSKIDGNLPAFIRVEYDCNAFAERSLAPKAYDLYAEKKAPSIKPALQEISKKVTREVTAGDKYIYATTDYHIKLSKGYTCKEVDTIVKILEHC